MEPARGPEAPILERFQLAGGKALRRIPIPVRTMSSKAGGVRYW